VDRYLAREFLPPFGVALLAFLAFIALQVVIGLSDVVLSRGFGAGELFKLLGLKLPSLAVLAVPAGALLAIFWALGRLAGGQEVLAFQAVGYSLRRLSFPFIVFGVVLSGLCFLISEYAVPAAEGAYRNEYLRLVLGERTIRPQEEVFFRGPKGDLYYIRRYRDGEARGIVIYDLAGRIAPPAGDYPCVVTAASGRFARNVLELREGRVLHFDAQGALQRLDGFSRLRLELGADVERLVLGGRTSAEMSLRELSARIQDLRRAGVDPRALLVEFHGRLAVILSPLIFALFGTPLGFLLGRQGRITGAAVAFLIAGATQALFLWTKTLAKQGVLPPPLGAWLPAVPLAVAGLLLFLGLDRRRFLFLLVWLLLPWMAMGGAPPFSFKAEELSFPLGEKLLVAQGATVSFSDYTLEAREFVAREKEGLWLIEGKGVKLSGEKLSLVAEELEVSFDTGGEVASLSARTLSGESTFKGPRKEESLRFTAAEAEATFSGGELRRLVAEQASFTTCPCLQGAPYTVRADTLVYLPDRWLYARNVRISSFGLTVWWLPFYVNRLGKGGVSLFPEIGRAGGEWFLKWNFPFRLWEEFLGSFGLTFYPRSGRILPSFFLSWDQGDLRLGPSGLNLRGRGETAAFSWSGTLSLSEGKIRAALKGEIARWSWNLAWERRESGGTSSERAPEVSLSRRLPFPGGQVHVTLSGGRYLEGEREALRAGMSLDLSRKYTLGPLSLSLPTELRFDIYREEGVENRERVTLSPRISLAGLSLGYSLRLGKGSSPLSQDRLPMLSRLSLSLSGAEEGLRQSLSLGYDLLSGKVLPGTWEIRGKRFRVSFVFSPRPLSFQHLALSLAASFPGLSLQGRWETALDGSRWGDILLHGNIEMDGLQGKFGVRIHTFPFELNRASAAFTLELDPDYELGIAGEYDFSRARLVQGMVRLSHTLSGCLTLGIEVGTGGWLIIVEVPAFREAKLKFSPQDAGLRWGG